MRLSQIHSAIQCITPFKVYYTKHSSRQIENLALIFSGSDVEDLELEIYLSKISVIIYFSFVTNLNSLVLLFYCMKC